MSALHDDTIYALSSGSLPAGVAVVRISGPAALSALKQLSGSNPPARRAELRTIRSRNDIIIDKALVLAFPGPHSFTGEDCVEVHLHGGKAVFALLFEELSAMPGLRMAEQGEFTRRAMENGKLDLVEVEGLADLLAAETEMQRRLAVEQSGGGLSRLYNGWAERLTRARALIEAELDFADEEDVPGSVSDRVWGDMRSLRSEMAAHLAKADVGEIIRDGLKIVIIGPPNAGKSSLLNKLASREVAIVTDIAGTTRDVLHVDLDMDGYKIRLFDTAGLRASEDVVEQEGIRRAQAAAKSADMILALSEIGDILPPLPDDTAARVVKVGTKLDIHGASALYDVCLSVKTGVGLDELRRIVLDHLKSSDGGTSLSLPSRLRHRHQLNAALDEIGYAVDDEAASLDIRAEYLRLSAVSLGRITGRVDVEELLGMIFSEFCIGK